MIYRLLSQQAKLRPEKIAVAGEHSALTHGELLDQVQKKAAFFQSLKLKAGDSILVGLPPSPEFYVVLHAAAAVGITTIPALPSEKIPDAILNSNPSLAIGGELFLREVQKVFTGLKATVLWDPKEGLRIPDPAFSFKPRKLVRQEGVLASFSSGTTGTPLLYLRSAEMLVERAGLRAQILGMNSADALLATRPFNNGGSIHQYVFLPLFAGCKVVVRQKFERFAALRAIAQERVTILYAVPFIFEMLASIPASHHADLSSLRLCISGGAALSRSVWERFHQRFGIRIRQFYGGNQISPAFSYSLSGLPDTVGHVSGPFPMAIVDDRGTALGPGEVGEIAFDYARIPPAWKKHLRDNPNRAGRYIHSGDLGKIDRDGNLYILGRKSPFIKVGGNRVEPAEVEKVLRDHPDINDAVVYPLNPGQPDEAVAALLVSDKKLTAREILRHCVRLLEGHKCPRKIEFRKRLPRNAHGKIMRHLFERGEGA
jgi:long-chain acyl-CoA synthetase